MALLRANMTTTNENKTPTVKRSSCQRCLRPTRSCYCHTLGHIENRWPVLIVQHQSEVGHAIGTAPIAQLSLQHCQTMVYPKPDASNISALLDEMLASSLPPILIYPDDQASDTIKLAALPARPLVFLDGTWRKTQRLLHEIPQLQQLEKVNVAPRQPSRYRIRKSGKPGGLATVEAIAFALETLESAPGRYQPLLDTMDWMIEQQISAMGREVYERNYLKNEH